MLKINYAYMYNRNLLSRSMYARSLYWDPQDKFCQADASSYSTAYTVMFLSWSGTSVSALLLISGSDRKETFPENL